MRTSAYRSPRVPSPARQPCPRRRILRPDDEPGGMVIITSLSSVGRRTLPPRTATGGDTSTVVCRSSPSTRKRACGSWRIVMNRSPCRPSGPRSPRPARRSLRPSGAAAGIVTLTRRCEPSRSRRVTLCRPPFHACSSGSVRLTSRSVPRMSCIGPRWFPPNRSSQGAACVERPPKRCSKKLEKPLKPWAPSVCTSHPGGHPPRLAPAFCQSRPKRSYFSRFSGSFRTSYASATRLKRSSASAALLTSGCSLRASFR
jgi:hypothetical protein